MNFFKRQADKLGEDEKIDQTIAAFNKRHPDMAFHQYYKGELISKLACASESYSRAILWAVVLGILGGQIQVVDCIFRVAALLLIPQFIASAVAEELVKECAPLHCPLKLIKILEVTLFRRVFAKSVVGIAVGYFVIYFVKSLLTGQLEVSSSF